MSKFINAMKENAAVTYTENGAYAINTTGSDLLDLFASVGAYRGRTNQEIEHAFSKALAEDELLALKILFYSRDVRGGLGERRTFRVMLRHLAKIKPKLLRPLIELIPYYGRWDDLYELIDTPLEKDMWKFIKEQFYYDRNEMIREQPISLLAKWLKSVNTSSKESRELGKLTARKLGLKEATYRKLLARMRKHIDVTEVKMSTNKWDEIIYSQVPSYAMKRYRKSFELHDPKRFSEFICKVSLGEEKINASTLYPYDILSAYNMHINWKSVVFLNEYDEVLEQQWKALPEYVEGNHNVIVMADTSGSMEGRPIESAIGLAMYFAERNDGPFKDVFMTFSSRPSFVTLKGTTLYDKIKNVPSIVSNTNLESAFDLILQVALDNDLGSEDIPKSLVIISDMEFDSATGRNSMLFYDKMKLKFLGAGYQIPNIVFWNVDSRQDTFHIKEDYTNVQLFSGQSVTTFKNVLNSIGKTPYEAMLGTLNSDRYKYIEI